MPQCHHVGAGFARPKCIPIDFYNRMEMIWHNNIFATSGPIDAKSAPLWK